MKQFKKILFALVLTCISNYLFADPPVPTSTPTTCPSVQCFVIDSVVCIDTTTVDIYFSTLNWFNTTVDLGVDQLRVIPTFFSKLQVTMLQAGAPAGWMVSFFSPDSAIFTIVPPTLPIMDVALCAPCASGPLGSCGNMQSGFRIRIGNISSLDCFTANWRHFSQGVDNGDNMNFGSMSWCVGNCPLACSMSVPCPVQATYSNTPFAPSFFVPTLSQWGVFILCLISLALGIVFVAKRQRSIAFAGNTETHVAGNVSLFNRDLYLKTYAKVLGVGIVALASYFAYSGHVTLLDTIGIVVSTSIIAYIIHFILMRKNKVA